MGIFSFFAAPDDDVEGSYCETNTRHVDYHKGDEIDEEVAKAEKRGDSVSFGNKDFNDSAVNTRHDEDGKPIVSGPKKPWWK